MVRPVAAAHVVDHLAAAFVIEVHVDIGHGDALGVQKALKEQAVFQGVYGGNAQAVGDDGTGAAAAPRADAHAVGARVVDKIPDDEKIIHIAHAGDHAQFVFHALARVRVILAVALFQPLFAQGAQVGKGVRFALGQGKFGQVGGGKVKVHLAARGDFRRVFNGLREVGEQGAHLVLALDVQFPRGHLHAVGVGKGLAGLDAHEHFLRVRVGGGEVVAVVGDDQGNVQFPRQAHQPRQYLLFLRDTVILQFHIEIARPEDVHIPLRHFAGLVIPPVEQQLGQIARKTGRQRNQTPGILFQQRVIHAGAVVKPTRKALGYQTGKVFVALVVFAQQDQMRIFAELALLFVHIRADIHLAANDRVNARVLAGAVKIHHAVHHAVVGNGAGVHAQLLQTRHKRLDGTSAVQKAVFGMQMQMCKHSFPLCMPFYKRADNIQSPCRKNTRRDLPPARGANPVNLSGGSIGRRHCQPPAGICPLLVGQIPSIHPAAALEAGTAGAPCSWGKSRQSVRR